VRIFVRLSVFILIVQRTCRDLDLWKLLP
jgi:hypothetical protein